MTKSKIKKIAKTQAKEIRASSDRKWSTWHAFKQELGCDWYINIHFIEFFYKEVERELLMIGDIPGRGNKARRRMGMNVINTKI